MKTKFFLIVLFLIGYQLPSHAERPQIADKKDSLQAYFEKADRELKAELKGLSAEQFNFKPSAEQWSIAECLDHIIKTEGALLSEEKKTMEAPVDPALRSEVKMAPTDLIAMIENRSQKFKAPPEISPAQSSYEMKKLLKAYEKQRKTTWDYVNQFDAEALESHVVKGEDGNYSSGLLMGYYLPGHAMRHTAQIREVKQNPNYPK